jgi:hypothetical protein
MGLLVLYHSALAGVVWRRAAARGRGCASLQGRASAGAVDETEPPADGV